MRKFTDIKTVLYRQADLGYTITRNITGTAAALGKNIITYEDELSLGTILETLRETHDSKEILILKEFQGRKFQKCPGSPNVICCNYYLLNTCFNCLYDCTYCFLNSYLNSFGITQFVNLDELPALMNEHVSGSGRITRIGTGEFTDSLMFDEITGIAAKLIAHTAGNRNIFLEFKTKSDNIDHLLDIPQKGNTVLAWTLNTPRNIDLYEKDTSCIDRRIDAAQKACGAGYLVALHFDPIIIYENYLDDYSRLFEKLKTMVSPDRTAWISLGCFRYSPGFKEIIKHKYPGEMLTTEEMFPGIDGKYRYLEQTRSAVYRFFYNSLKSVFPETYIYFCMESSSMWRRITGLDFKTSEDLEESLCSSLNRFIIC